MLSPMVFRCRVPISFLIFLLMGVVCFSQTAEQPKGDTAKATKAFQEAVQQRNLLSRAELPDQKQWIACAQAFRQVYLIDRNYYFAGDAAYEEGLIYQQIGDIFGGNEHYQTAVNRLQFLITNYADNSHCPDALRRIRDIHILLKNETAAKEADRVLRERYPRESAELNAPEPATKTTPDNKTTGTPQQPSPPAAKPAVVAPKQVPSNAQPANAQPANAQPAPDQSSLKTPAVIPAVVNDISYHSEENSGHVVITLDRPAVYMYDRIINPDRIYFDIENAVLAEKYRNKTIPFNNRNLYRVRTAQRDANTVRIVLDISSVGEQAVVTLKNPYRIEVELRHAGAREPVPPDTPKPEIEPESEVKPDPRPEVKSEVELEVKTVSKPDAESSEENPTKNTVAATAPVKDASAVIPKATARTGNGTRTLTRMLGLKINRIVLDPGHGGDELGAIGPGGMYEKDLVLAIASELKTKLETELDVEVILTRDADMTVSLERRAEIANENQADLFISIHANSSSSRSLSGVETYYLDFAKTDAEREVAARENASSKHTVSELEDLVKKIATDDKTAESRELASLVHKNLFSDTRKLIPASKDRGVRSAPFVVLIGANMPSILVEVAFISNPSDEKILSREITQKALAQALYSGILGYMDTLGSRIVRNQTQ